MSTADSLDVPAVVEQFQRSEQVLGELRERIRGIVLAEEGAERAAGNLDAATTQVAATAKALETVLAEVEAAGRATVDALTAAQGFLAGTDLSGLQERIDAAGADSREALEQVRTEISASASASQSEIKALQTQLTELAATIPEVEGLRAEIETLKGHIPARTRKRLGI